MSEGIFRKPKRDKPEWQIAIVDGQPEQVCNRAMVEELIKQSPLGEAEARRRINAMQPDGMEPF